MKKYCRVQRISIICVTLFIGLYALDQTGVKVSSYHSSEISKDANLVSKVRFGDSIIRLGDVRNISNQQASVCLKKKRKMI